MKEERICKTKRGLIYSLLSAVALFSTLFLSVFCSQQVNAESLSINSFGLYGQKTYGAANTWQNNLSYGGTSMHSVYKWEIWSSNLSTSQTGKYATVNFSGFINIPQNFRVNLDQGFTIEQCVVGGHVATLSNVAASWTYVGASSSSGPLIMWAADASLEFDTNSLSGQAYCTFRSNSGVYFLQHITNGTQNISFGTTNFNATFSNNLSEELLQQQIQQNQTIINQNQTIIDQDNEDREDLQNTSENAEQQGDTAASSAETTGTTLFAAFTTLLTALTGVHTTNCELNIPSINMQGGTFALGTLDLCTYDIPQGLATLGSLLLVFLIIPMGINCAKRMLALYNELLGGK